MGEQMKTHKWDDVKARSKVSPARQAEIEEEVFQEAMEMNLSNLRSAAGLTQVELAAKLEMVQSGVARIEGKNDPHLSTLRRYVHALGGELKIQAVLGGKTIDLVA